MATSTAVVAHFTEALKPATVNGETFTLSHAGTPVAGVVTYANAEATFTPAVPLSRYVTYTATVTTDMKDTDDHPLVKGLSWTFTTGG